MKKVKFGILVGLCALALSSCKLDNYDSPNAAIFGSVKDSETGALIEQDIHEGGTIEIVEFYGDGTGIDDKRALVLKSDGTYRNNFMYAGTYKWLLLQNGNTISETLATNYVLNKGENEFNVNATPLCRINNLSITKSGNTVTATFNVTLPAAVKAKYDANPNAAGDYWVNAVGLYAHMTHDVVGAPASIAKSEVTISWGDFSAAYIAAGGNLNYPITLTLNVDDAKFVPGQTYYFRAGARVKANNSKFNYGSRPVAFVI